MSLPPTLSIVPDDDNDWHGLTAGLSSALTLTLMSHSSASTQNKDTMPSMASSSGKFNPFTFVGSAISGGGPKSICCLHTQKRVSSISTLDWSAQQSSVAWSVF